MDEERDRELNIIEGFQSAEDLFQSNEAERNKSWEDAMWNNSEARDRDFEKKMDTGTTGFFANEDNWWDRQGELVERDIINPSEQAITENVYKPTKTFLKGNGYKADEVSYVERPHMKNASAAKRRRYAKTRKITYGSGPLGMMVIMVLDFLFDAVIEIGRNIGIFFTDGFEFVHDLLLGGFQGIFPGVNQQVEGETISAFAGTCISYKYLRYFLTLISPPIGVFLGKGLRGYMTILIALLLTYIHFLLGVVYAFVVTSRCRYADYYEKREAKIYGRINDKLKEENKGSFQETLGLGILFGSILFIIYLMVKMA
jgi:uncharacterized membrane protein YqaE (UPF0057 family)